MHESTAGVCNKPLGHIGVALELPQRQASFRVALGCKSKVWGAVSLAKLDEMFVTSTTTLVTEQQHHVPRK